MSCRPDGGRRTWRKQASGAGRRQLRQHKGRSTEGGRTTSRTHLSFRLRHCRASAGERERAEGSAQPARSSMLSGKRLVETCMTRCRRLRQVLLQALRTTRVLDAGHPLAPAQPHHDRATRHSRSGRPVGPRRAARQRGGTSQSDRTPFETGADGRALDGSRLTELRLSVSPGTGFDLRFLPAGGCGGSRSSMPLSGTGERKGATRRWVGEGRGRRGAAGRRRRRGKAAEVGQAEARPGAGAGLPRRICGSRGSSAAAG